MASLRKSYPYYGCNKLHHAEIGFCRNEWYRLLLTAGSAVDKKLEITSCCNFSVGVALNVWFTTSGMCAKNNTCDPYICGTNKQYKMWLQPINTIVACCHSQCEALRTCCSGFPIVTKWCCDQDVKVMPVVD